MKNFCKYNSNMPITTYRIRLKNHSVTIFRGISCQRKYLKAVKKSINYNYSGG